ncbi:signal transduction protein [Thermotomaculum hydrothermale]|uniref:diguanylate cyclase n=1 Tax=Thermotomaculum hydrothermale TaxID=981385 RepID=A0A7R6PM41_9BACT|nr:GGDEF domain-containing protein [Thermotomaculum hydrothermale]BBB32078.1 signal transduction protein [Thermotomaculum hydrothermale]
MNIIFVDLDKKKEKEFKTFFERSGYSVVFLTFDELLGINSENIKNGSVVVVCSDNIENALKCFDTSLSFAKNVVLLKDNYTHGWYRIFHKKGVFDFLKFRDGMEEIGETIFNAFREENPFYKNKLLEREKSLLKLVKDVCLTLEFSQLLNLLIDTFLDFIHSENALVFVKNPEIGIKEIKRGKFKNAGFVESILKEVNADINSFEKNRKIENDGLIYLIFPLIWEGVVQGIILLEIESEKFKSDMIFTCENFLKEIEPALVNSLSVEQTKKLTTIDDLTTCFNRRFFDEYIEIVFKKSKENGKKFSLIFMDLDNLKDVNTKYGHLVGSQILKSVAEKTIDAVRGIDKVCRFGGDEFCIILPDTDSRGAKRVAERIKENIVKNEYFLKDYPDIKVTASFGIATYPDHGDDVESLIRVADNAMYMVKMTTKNAIYVPEIDNGG